MNAFMGELTFLFFIAAGIFCFIKLQESRKKEAAGLDMLIIWSTGAFCFMFIAAGACAGNYVNNGNVQGYFLNDQVATLVLSFFTFVFAIYAAISWKLLLYDELWINRISKRSLI